MSLKTEMDDPEASIGIGVETVPAIPIIEVNNLISRYRTLFVKYILYLNRILYLCWFWSNY